MSQSDGVADELKKKPKVPRNLKTGKGHVTPPEVVATIINCFISTAFNTDKEIADHCGVSPQVVGKLRKTIPIDLKELASSVNSRGARIDTLVFEFISEGFESLKRISKVTEDNEWLKKQTAVELATFYGVKADRNIKLLEVIDRATREPEPETEPISAVED